MTRGKGNTTATCGSVISWLCASKRNAKCAVIVDCAGTAKHLEGVLQKCLDALDVRGNR